MEARNHLGKLGFNPSVVNAIIQSRSCMLLDPSILPGHRSPQLEAIQNLEGEEVARYLSGLPHDMAEVLRARHGIAPYSREHTLDEIGKALGTSRERIRQIEAEGIERIRLYHKEMGREGWKVNFGRRSESYCIERSEIIARSLLSRSEPGREAAALSKSSPPCVRTARVDSTPAKSTPTSTRKRTTTTGRRVIRCA